MGDDVQILSGAWRLACDPDNRGKADHWFVADRNREAKETRVPGILQETFPDHHGVVWYWHRFFPNAPTGDGCIRLLRFAYVDYYAEFWLNGTYIGSHEGPEMPFEFDVTRLLADGCENLLAVRLINPIDEPIDGFLLEETANRNRIPRGISPGSGFNAGGILQKVELHSVPKIRITGMTVVADAQDGNVVVHLDLANDTDATHPSILSVRILQGIGHPPVASGSLTIQLDPGTGSCRLDLAVRQFHLWSPDDPVLYEACAVLAHKTDDGSPSSFFAARFGFRDFRVEKGFFRLNGKRIFLRSTHTGNHYPLGFAVPADPALLRQDLVYAKAAGFNMVRFICGTARPEQLDFCDEIGLLIYEECASSWGLKDSPWMAERFDGPTLEMVRRDRNHPSVVVWGLLNETFDGPVFRHAVSLLPRIRVIDDSRLVLLSSGRWDRQRSIGTVSNPGSREWQCEWGEESPGAAEIPYTDPRSWDWGYPAGLYAGMGDVHAYPNEPRAIADDRLIRNLGKDTKPVFLSEWGVGSLFDVVRTTRHFEEIGAREDLHDAGLFRTILARFEADFRAFGLETIYPFAEDLIRESYVLHTRQRARVFDCVRSNPRFCGYNLTGMLDHGYCGEGLWSFFREWKTGIVDVLRDGWAPLRWCLFVEPGHAFAGQPLRIEAVLANEDVLGPGEYPANFRLFGAEGPVWEKQVTVRIPVPVPGEEGQLALTVLDEEISLEGQAAGRYVLSASLLRGGAPTGGRLAFRLSEPCPVLPENTDVVILGVGQETRTWLEAHGAILHGWNEPRYGRTDLILVGGLPDPESPDSGPESLWERAEAGSTVLVLSPDVWTDELNCGTRLPFQQKSESGKILNWLYHMECVALPHPYFDGLPGKGMLDGDVYGTLIPNRFLRGGKPPDEVAAVSFAIGYPGPTGYDAGVLLAAYRHGAGRIVLNTFRILENLGKNPAADRMFFNLLTFEKERVEGN